MGGKPRKDTPRDMRLKENKHKQRNETARGLIYRKKSDRGGNT